MVTIHAPAPWKPEIEWIAGFLFNRCPDLEWEVCDDGSLDRIVLSHEARSLELPNTLLPRMVVAAEGGVRWLPQPPFPIVVPGWPDLEARLHAPSIPVLSGTGAWQQSGPTRFGLDVDIFGSCYLLLSRIEESRSTVRDEHGRFMAHRSLAYAGGFLHRPLADEYAEWLLSAMHRVWPQIGRRQKYDRMEISHDVDSPGQYAFSSLPSTFKSMGADLFKRNSPRLATRRLRARMQSRRSISHLDPHNTFDWLMEAVEWRGLSSDFYFMTGLGETAFDSNYRIDSAPIRNLMTRIQERGHAVGLHPSYRALDDDALFKREVQAFRESSNADASVLESLGCRMHYLRWNGPETWVLMEQLGITHDATLGYADVAGFRCGTCFRYQAFSTVERRPLRIEVRPLIVMECTVIDPCYMNLGSGEAAFNVMKTLKSTCEKVGGVFSLLWHNSRLVERDERSLFLSILDTNA